MRQTENSRFKDSSIEWYTLTSIFSLEPLKEPETFVEGKPRVIRVYANLN